jgi:hypothetical protein
LQRHRRCIEATLSSGGKLAATKAAAIDTASKRAAQSHLQRWHGCRRHVLQKPAFQIPRKRLAAPEVLQRLGIAAKLQIDVAPETAEQLNVALRDPEAAAEYDRRHRCASRQNPSQHDQR